MEKDFCCLTQEKVLSIKKEISSVVVGQEILIEQLAIILLTGGHALLEGVPGLGKTLLSATLAKTISANYTRIQFTPDLMPSDVTGTKVFDIKSGNFYLKKGPVFTNILLADEINRTPPKTQAALLECMEEKQVTIDGETINLEEPFLVLATQNPVEYEGTYPLPQAQLDRFMMKIIVDYVSKEEEDSLLEKYSKGIDGKLLHDANVEAVCTVEDIIKCRREIELVGIRPELISYITSIAGATRNSPATLLGASPRASIALLMCSKTLAAIRGRDFVLPEDIKDLALPILRHRIILKPEASMDGLNEDNIIINVLNTVEVPR